MIVAFEAWDAIDAHPSGIRTGSGERSSYGHIDFGRKKRNGIACVAGKHFALVAGIKQVFAEDCGIAQ